MSNGLEQAGIKYSLDIGGVTQNANTIINNFGRIEQGQKKLTDGAKSFDQAVGANGRSMRLFASEIVNLSGVGGNFGGIFAGLLSALGPVDLALVGVTATLGLLKYAYDENAKSIQNQEQALANSVSDYQTFIDLRNKIQDTPQGKVASFSDNSKNYLTAGFGQVNNQLDDASKSLGQAFGDALAIGINQAFGLHKDDLAQGFERDLRAALQQAASTLNPFDILAQYQKSGQTAVNTAQAQSATKEFVSGAEHRAAAAALADEVNKMVDAGTTADQLIPKLYALAQAQGRVVTGADLQGQANQLVSDSATQAYEKRQAKIEQFNQQIVAIQQDGFDQTEALAEQHAERIASIEEQGGQQRANLARSYARQLASIEENLQDARASAAESRSDALASAEENAQERRAKIAQSFQERLADIEQAFADRRAEIEQTYQDTVKRINEDYATSYFDAASRNDAKALVAARLNRDKQLKEAADTRDKDNSNADKQRQKDIANARKDYEKQQRDLDENLAKQKAQIEKDYQRRLRDADQQAAKERAHAAQTYRDQLSDLAQAQAQQKAAEAKSYRERQAQLDAAEVKRIASVKAAMDKEVGVTRNYVQEIADSIKSILDPDKIASIINEIQRQIKAKIDVIITPFKKEGDSVSKALGGFDPIGQLTQLHPGEWVIPNLNSVGASRFNEVMGGMQRYYGSRSMPYSGSNTSTSSRNGSATVTVSLDSRMLHGVVTDVAGDVVIQVLEEAERVSSR